MSFWGCEFLLNGISCKIFNLMIYETEHRSQGDISFSSFRKPHEDTTPWRYNSYFYGYEQTEPLTFSITFGLDPDLLDQGEYLSHDTVAMITSWLMGSGSYQRFEILQEDMYGYHYNVRVSDLTLLSNGLMPYGFSCTFSCDSPFAYTEETEMKWTVTEEDEIILWNESTSNCFFMPKMRITKVGNGDISITNHSDNNLEFILTDVEDGDVIFVDNEKQIIINETTNKNMYSNFNFCFFRMVPGENTIKLSGSYEISLLLCFPVNIGA